MEIQRTVYLKKLIDRKENGLVKIITWVRRCGKSYLLFELYYNYLRSTGISDDNIIKISLDMGSFAIQRNPIELSKYIEKT